MNNEQTAKIMACLASAYPRQPVSASTMQIYCRMLADLDYSQVNKAITKIMVTSKFFPTIAEIREAALATSGNQLPSAEEAWNEVELEIRRVGSYGDPSFSNAVITKAVDSLGGWVRLCRSEEPPGVERAHFVRFYTSFAARENERQNCATLLDQLQARIDQRKQPQLEARH